ncbi:aminopeptidase [Propionispora hippei]|uniref:Leucyl aminopeptidase (Aminopeptidase T) n=1 Tax=Propionispora hippei DSM 15287 TaxID=1123003 RepID=A0A1M6I089_9FIRM|nr:aminopeptidase [Propionispora hippei]SHJ27912.1 Leucyl aminopeptidase (aminopeptidase T) [Propionispora hippei DSM 15287]
MNTQLLEKYARLIVKTGINLEKNQTLVINSPIESAPFSRALAETAYKEGARDVVIVWRDELFTKIRYTHAPEEVFSEYPDWQKELYMTYVRQGAAFVSIAASDPELLKDIEPGRIAKAQKAGSTALREYRERLMSNQNTWCVVSVPTAAWAKKVFPDLSEEAAIARLWELICQVVRVDTPDPVAAWNSHKQNLQQRLDFLNGHNFKTLHYKNSLGTDLTVELPEGHIWLGGSEHTPDGREFIANMPTEEVFTLPQRTGVNGKVVSSKPLNYNGNLIDGFMLTFTDGKIVDFTAKTGYESLKHLLETDEGASYLGEVALVPFDSPISNANILFYNTLFDENASCHLAFGKAYPVCLANSENYTAEELAQKGVNDSLVHEDFMLGTADLEILGTTRQGQQIPVFKNGNFAF